MIGATKMKIRVTTISALVLSLAMVPSIGSADFLGIGHSVSHASKNVSHAVSSAANTVANATTKAAYNTCKPVLTRGTEAAVGQGCVEAASYIGLNCDSVLMPETAGAGGIACAAVAVAVDTACSKVGKFSSSMVSGTVNSVCGKIPH